MVKPENKPKVIGSNKSKAKVKETKVQTFKRIAVPRVKAILSKIRIFGNCANRNNYEYTQEQIEKISITLSEALDDTMNKFEKSKVEQESFEL